MDYMNMKNEKLRDIGAANGLDYDSYMNENGSLRRKDYCDALRALDIKAGNPIDQPVIVEADGTAATQEQIKHKAVLIMFYSMEENDLPYVQLGLNGRALYIPKEREVWIPHEFIEGCLRNAVMDKMVMDIDFKGNIRYIIKKVPRFQYNILDIKTFDNDGKEV